MRPVVRIVTRTVEMDIIKLKKVVVNGKVCSYPIKIQDSRTITQKIVTFPNKNRRMNIINKF